MSKRDDEWMAEFGELANDQPEEVRALILDGSIEICPCCLELSAYSWDDATAYDAFEDGIIPGGFQPAPGTIAHIGTCGSWEWECGHCGRHFVESDSPINHPAYTHKLD